MYLFKTLPLQRWKLTLDDLSLLEHLILNHPITSTENSLSRHILAKLFSGCNENNIKYVISLSCFFQQFFCIRSFCLNLYKNLLVYLFCCNTVILC